MTNNLVITSYNYAIRKNNYAGIFDHLYAKTDLG